MRTIVLRIIAIAALAIAVSCASTQQAPEVTIEQTSQVNARVLNMDDRAVPLSGKGIPVEFRLNIANPFEYEVKLVAVELESVGSTGAYELRRVRHSFDVTIPAKSDSVIDLRAWVLPLQVGTKNEVSNAVMLRGLARFQSGSGTVNRNFVAKVQ